ncbi:MAG TPA: type II toxin-antitoxin system Phd/YefM family antitoxin [Rhodanobacteraceae bacterium]|nr:type II toxin-antitoxin system Phd/YefM family antitoxin [Rhodanobacteraceae bacterium]
MKTISASHAKQSFASVLDATAQGPVVIQRQKRDTAVILSMQEYERLARLNVAEFQRFCDSIGADAASRGMDESVLAGLLADEA